MTKTTVLVKLFESNLSHQRGSSHLSVLNSDDRTDEKETMFYHKIK